MCNTGWDKAAPKRLKTQRAASAARLCRLGAIINAPVVLPSAVSDEAACGERVVQCRWFVYR